MYERNFYLPKNPTSKPAQNNWSNWSTCLWLYSHTKLHLYVLCRSQGVLGLKKTSHRHPQMAVRLCLIPYENSHVFPRFHEIPYSQPRPLMLPMRKQTGLFAAPGTFCGAAFAPETLLNGKARRNLVIRMHLPGMYKTPVNNGINCLACFLGAKTPHLLGLTSGGFSQPTTDSSCGKFWDGGPLVTNPTYTPYIVDIYWANPLFKGLLAGLNSYGPSIPRVPPFSLWSNIWVWPSS